MTSIENLQAADAALDTTAAAILAQLSALAAQITALNSGNNPAIDAVVADMTDKVAALNAALPPAAGG